MRQAITRSEDEQLKATSVRLDPQVYSILFNRAKKHTRSMNGEINVILKEYLAQRGNEYQVAG